MGPSAVPEFQSTLVRLSDNLNGKLAALTSKLSTLDRRSQLRYVTDAYPAIATPYIAAAGDLTTVWYDAQPVKAGATAFRAAPAGLPPVEKLGANGRWAMLQRNPADALQGAARRRLFRQSRDTVLDNVEREGVHWVRQARAGACGFCRMTATRVLTAGQPGAPGHYRSEGSASRNTHRFDMTRGHDHCRCVAVPLRDGVPYVAPDYVHDWLEDYEAVSRGPDGLLLNPQRIAQLMENRGRAREARFAAEQAPKALPDSLPVNLDEPIAAAPSSAGLDQARLLTGRTADRAEAIAQPLRDRVAQAKAIADRADEVVSTAAKVSGQVKSVADVADKLLGGTVPIVRSVKAIVDAADKGLQTAAGVTGEAVKVAKLADKTIADTVGIAHGVKQIADEVGGVLDEAAAIAVGARTLLTDTGAAVRSVAADVQGADGLKDFASRVGTAVDTAGGIQADGTALLERARKTADAAQAIPGKVQALPDVVRKPVADAQKLAQGVRDAVVAVEQAGDDAAAVARSVRRLVDQVADWRAAQAAAQQPVRVASERVATADAAGVVDAEIVEQKAIGPAPKALEAAPAASAESAGPLAIEAAPVRLALEAAPPAPVPDLDQIGRWLDAEDDHLAAVEYWRRVDADDLHSIPAEIRADPLPAPRTRGDELRDAVAKAEADLAAHDERKSATPKQKQQRRDSQKIALKNARADVDAAIADGTIDAPIAVKPQRAKAVTAAERTEKFEADMSAAVAEFEEAVATGDDALIDAAADRMEALQLAEDKAAERAQRAAERRSAKSRAEQEKIGALIDDGLDQVQAEAQVTGRSVESIVRRNFIAQARADGHRGKGFDDLLGSVFQRTVDELYLAAEEATNGHMLKHEYELKVGSYKRLWYVTDATARKWATDEMLGWFDENGRLTLGDMRESILSGRSIADIAGRRNNQDYLQ